MARTVIPEVERVTAPILHKWKRIAGKLHTKVNGVKIVVVPGDIMEAPEGKYTQESKIWEDLGLAIQPEKPKMLGGVFRKEQTKSGWLLFKDTEAEPVNDVPLSEQEVDDLINASLESA
jgi:hypothetical protein